MELLKTQPEALRLAEIGQWLEGGSKAKWSMDVCEELRRLHAVNAELLQALKDARWRIANLVGPNGAQGLDRTALDKIDAAIAKAGAV